MASTVFATVSTPGPPGPAGPAGPPGYGGTWIVQSGPPSNLIGNNGDMYLNNSAGAGGGDVYGPKASGVWPASTTNIKGAPGTPGAPGYSPTYIVQASPPTAGQGNNGDMYINSATSDLYGPKTSGAWGPIVANLRGQTGAQGPPGVGYNPRGAWLAGTIYAQGDQVSYNSQLWISLQGGNINNTPSTSPTFWQAVGSGASQTPWLSAIDGGGFNLGNVGQIAVGNPGATPPFTGAGFVHLIVGPTVASSQCGIITAASNTATTNGVVGELTFSNYNLATSDKRVSTIDVLVDGANANYSAMLFRTTATGSGGLLERMRITSAGYVGIANSGVLPDANTANPALIVGATGPSSTAGEVTVCGNAASGAMGAINFANYANATAEKRIALILSSTDGAANSGSIQFLTSSAGASGERMRITSGGNVGIGTGTPASMLDVYGSSPNMSLRQATAGPEFLTALSASSNNIQWWKDSTPSFAAGIGISSPSSGLTNGNVIISTFNGSAWADRVTVTNAGNVGIGTSSPQDPLHVLGPSFDVARFESTSANSGISIKNSNPYQFEIQTVSYNALTFVDRTAGGVARMAIMSDGKVGIGTTGPLQKLDIASQTFVDTFMCVDVGGERIRFGMNFSTGFPTDNIGAAQVIVESNGNLMLSSRTNNPCGIMFYTSTGSTAIERMRITSSGLVGIGRTPTTYPLECQGDINITGTYRVNGTPISSGSGGGITAKSTVTGSRSFNTNYPNSTGKPMFVSVVFGLPANGPYMALVADTGATPTATVAYVSNPGANAGTFTVCGWVLPGENYRVNTGTPAAPTSWVEWT